MTDILDAPVEWRLVAYLCLGYPREETETPDLERAGWEKRNMRKVVLLER